MAHLPWTRRAATEQPDPSAHEPVRRELADWTAAALFRRDVAGLPVVGSGAPS
jgi:hypothetical protein